MFQTGFWFCCKCSRQTGVWFGRKLGFRQHFGFLFSIPIFRKNTERDGGAGVIGSLGFDVQGWGGGGSCPIRTYSDRQKKGGGGGGGMVQKLDIFFGCHKFMVPKMELFVKIVNG